MKEHDIHKEMRKIMINSPAVKEYVDNTIKTAKYNWLTFLPLAIIYQFNNYFNIFFLFTAIILAIKVISPMDPGVAIVPFVIVIGVSVVREGIEDIKKLNYDKTYNNSVTIKINSVTEEEEKIKWSEARVGTVLKINKNEVVPADVLVIQTSLSSGFCYMETTNLDGESALKPREAVPVFKSLLTEEEVSNNVQVKNLNEGLKLIKLKGFIEVDQPNFNIYSVNGIVELQNNFSSTNSVSDQVRSDSNSRTFFNIDNVLLRGTTLKNVNYAYGLVLYTGVDTKIMKNIQNFSLKNSSIEKTLNKVIIVVIIIVFSICVGCTMFGMIFMAANVPNYAAGQTRSEYIYYAKSKDYPFTLEFFSLFGAFFIIFNNIIPISLTITFEIAKFVQVWIMSKDKQLYDENKDEKFKILSMKLQEDLGNVKYIFTDKTGTLTKNEMIFRACSIYSKLYYEEEEKDKKEINKNNEFDVDINNYNLNENIKNISGDEKINLGEIKKNIKKSVYSPLFNLDSIQNDLNSDLPIHIDDIEDSYYKSTRDVVIEFFLNIALNHNILTEVDEENNISYQGTNPDEVALVTAAKEIGIQYVSREGTKITIKIDNNDYFYEVLHKFDFTSERARSTIIVRENHTGDTKLFIKGSDDKIIKILNNFSTLNLENATKEHLEKFAKCGLRTLCYAVKVIDSQEYSGWDTYYKKLKYECLTDKSLNKELEEQIAYMESNCILLGVSGLEDLLQDEVRGTISQMLEAGIQMWMITGDKLDTAESIGYSSKLFDEDTEVFKIRNTSDKKEVLENMNKMLEDIINLENQINLMKLERKKKRKGQIKNKKKKKKDHNIQLINMNNYLNNKDDNANREDLNENKNKINIEENIPTQKIKKNEEEEESKTRHEECPDDIKYRKHKILNKEQNDKKQPIKNYNTQKYVNKILTEFDNYSSESRLSFEDSEIMEQPSQVDDVSVMKFMLDKNFFDNSIVNKKDFANTFMNKIIHLAVNRSRSASLAKRDSGLIPVIGNRNNNEIKVYENDNNIMIISPSKYKFDDPIIRENLNEIPLSIRLNKRNNIEIGIPNNDNELPIIDGEDIEEIDISNLYDHYRNQLNLIQERKNSVRKILKFTNFDFQNFRKKKTEDEEHNMRDVNLLNFGIIIEGNAISMCLDDEVKQTFWKLIKKSRSLICCRCTPIQKSDVVNFVKNKSGEVCLAIGDGGNDVNMIKSANVGVGIFGKEGYQAAFNSDYAISQFKYLKRLLFYHGRYSLLRNSYFIYFFFYKSLIFSVPNLWFAFFTGFSGTLLWDNFYFICYTSILSTIPPVVIMVYEEDIDMNFEGYHNKDILNNLIPDIYKEYRDSSPFNSLKFFIVFLLGIIHSAIIYFFPLFVFRFGNQDHTGRSHTLWDQSLLGVLTVLIVQYYIIFQDTFLYSTPVIIVHAIQITHNVVFFALYAMSDSDQLGAYTFDIISNLKFWFTLIITLAIDLLLVIISRKVDILVSDNIINNLRNRRFEDDYTRKIYIKKLEHMSKCTRSLAKFKKIYKQIDKYEAENYADKKMKDIVEMYRKNKINIRNSHSPYKNTPIKNRVLRSKSLDLGKQLKEKLKSINIKIQNSIQKRNSKKSNNSNKIIHNITVKFEAEREKEIQKRNEENINNNVIIDSVEKNKPILKISNSHVENNIPDYDIEKEIYVYDDIETKIVNCDDENRITKKEEDLENHNKKMWI